MTANRRPSAAQKESTKNRRAAEQRWQHHQQQPEMGKWVGDGNENWNGCARRKFNSVPQKFENFVNKTLNSALLLLARNETKNIRRRSAGPLG